MRITFENTEDDAVALSVFFSRHSRHIKAQKLVVVLIMAVFCVLAVVPTVLQGEHIADVVPALVIFGAVVFWLLGGSKARVAKAARKLLREHPGPGYPIRYEMDITEAGIEVKTRFSHSRMDWGAINRIASTPDYMFVFTGPMSAIVLPQARVLSGNYDTFIQQLQTRFDAALPMAVELPNVAESESPVFDRRAALCEDTRAGKHSGYGITSFVVFWGAIALSFFGFIAAVASAVISDAEPSAQDLEKSVFVVLILGAWGATFVGALLGLVGMVQTDRKKFYAVAGFVLNTIFLLGVIVLAVAH